MTKDQIAAQMVVSFGPFDESFISMDPGGRLRLHERGVVTRELTLADACRVISKAVVASGQGEDFSAYPAGYRRFWHRLAAALEAPHADPSGKVRQ